MGNVSMKHLKLRDQAVTLCSDLVTRHLGRLIAAIFVCVAVIVANSCKTQKGVEGSIVMGKEFSQSDFQKLRSRQLNRFAARHGTQSRHNAWFRRQGSRLQANVA